MPTASQQPSLKPIKTVAQARHNLRGHSCAVCGSDKRPWVLLCEICLAPLPMPTRNLMGVDLEEFMAVVAELRATRRAAQIGLRVVTSDQ